MNKGFLIDMDGVIYRSGQLIPGAVAALGHSVLVPHE
jgi:ribonucleotide monophosphatase NagD (HAD superfamily)